MIRVLTGATLIDGTGAAPVPDAAVVIDGDRCRLELNEAAQYYDLENPELGILVREELAPYETMRESNSTRPRARSARR